MDQNWIAFKAISQPLQPSIENVVKCWKNWTDVRTGLFFFCFVFWFFFLFDCCFINGTSAPHETGRVPTSTPTPVGFPRFHPISRLWTINEKRKRSETSSITCKKKKLMVVNWAMLNNVWPQSRNWLFPVVLRKHLDRKPRTKGKKLVGCGRV